MNKNQELLEEQFQIQEKLRQQVKAGKQPDPILVRRLHELIRKTKFVEEITLPNE